jgi:hypothetical protein
MKKWRLKWLIKEIVVEVLSDKDKNARTEHFSVRFTKDNAAAILLGNEYFGSALHYPNDIFSYDFSNKWMFNGDTLAFKLKLPQMKKPYSTLQELLDDLEKWYSTKTIKETLTEILGAGNFWMTPSAEIVNCEDHLQWALENVDLSKLFPDVYPSVEEVMNGESEFDEEDIYYATEQRGYIRIVVENEKILSFNYTKISNKQLKELKDFCIERDYILFDAVKRKEIDLL